MAYLRQGQLHGLHPQPENGGTHLLLKKTETELIRSHFLSRQPTDIHTSYRDSADRYTSVIPRQSRQIHIRHTETEPTDTYTSYRDRANRYTYVIPRQGQDRIYNYIVREGPFVTLGAGIAQWLERQTRDWKVAGSIPCWSGGRIFFSRVDFLCWLLFRYPFQPRVTAVARKRSRSFCQTCRWQVTAKHAYTLRMWLCMKWHGAWLYGVHRTCAETAAVSCGTSHANAVSTPLRWIFKKKKKKKKNRYKKLVTHVEPDASAVSLLTGAENSAI